MPPKTAATAKKKTPSKESTTKRPRSESSAGAADGGDANKRHKKRPKRDAGSALAQARHLWSEARSKTLTDEERKPKMEELMKTVSTLLPEGLMKSDVSRILQTCAKYCSDEQRHEILEHAKGKLVDLSSGLYTKKFVMRLYEFGNDAVRKTIVDELRAPVRRLVRHREASDVIDFINDLPSTKDVHRQVLVDEFFGKQYALFKTDSDQGRLAPLFARHPTKQPFVMQHLRTSLDECLERGTISSVLVHRPLAEYLSHATVTEASGIIDAASDAFVEILHTRDGARAAMEALWKSTPKQRKELMRSFRSHAIAIAEDVCGYLVLCAAFECIDDTVTMSKMLVAPLAAAAPRLALDHDGRRVLIHLLRPRAPQFFNGDTRALLALGDGNVYTKKDAQTRQKELCRAIAPSLVAMLTLSCRKALAATERAVKKASAKLERERLALDASNKDAAKAAAAATEEGDDADDDDDAHAMDMAPDGSAAADAETVMGTLLFDPKGFMLIPEILAHTPSVSDADKQSAYELLARLCVMQKPTPGRTPGVGAERAPLAETILADKVLHRTIKRIINEVPAFGSALLDQLQLGPAPKGSFLLPLATQPRSVFICVALCQQPLNADARLSAVADLVPVLTQLQAIDDATVPGIAILTALVASASAELDQDQDQVQPPAAAPSDQTQLTEITPTPQKTKKSSAKSPASKKKTPKKK